MPHIGETSGSLRELQKTVAAGGGGGGGGVSDGDKGDITVAGGGTSWSIDAGAAGAFYEVVYEFSVRNHAIELNPGELLGVRVGAAAFDAAGTWSMGVEVAWREGTSDVEA